MSLSVIVASILAAAAVSCWWPMQAPARRRTDAAPHPAERRLPDWMVPTGAGLAVSVLMGGLGGVLVGCIAGIAAWKWRSQTRSRGDVVEETRRALTLPVALDLLAACFSVGAAPARALSTVGTSLGGSLSVDFHTVARALDAGADVPEAWSLVSSADLDALASVLSRAHVTGAAITPLLAVLAHQQRQSARARAMDAARALGVRLTGPLGLCFLPAFVLVAVVPLVVSLLPVNI